MNERRDELSTADLAGQQPAGTAPAAHEDDPGAYRDPAAYDEPGAYASDDPDAHRTADGGAGPLDRLRRAFGGDDRGADDRGADDRGADDRGADDRGADDRGADDRGADDRGSDAGADAGADRGADTDFDRGADASADGGAGPVDRFRDAVGADDRDADAGADLGVDRSPADNRPLPPPSGGSLAAPVGGPTADPTPGVDVPASAGAATGELTPAGAATAGSAPANAGGPTTGPLLPTAEAERFRARWTDVQNGFVDSPRQAVQQADGLTAELMQHLAKTFADERGRLEGQWDRGDDVATDDLRTAFQRYRSFFERLLST